jgi:hypothetical protein
LLPSTCDICEKEQQLTLNGGNHAEKFSCSCGSCFDSGCGRDDLGAPTVLSFYDKIDWNGPDGYIQVEDYFDYTHTPAFSPGADEILSARLAIRH